MLWHRDEDAFHLAEAHRALGRMDPESAAKVDVSRSAILANGAAVLRDPKGGVIVTMRAEISRAWRPRTPEYLHSLDPASCEGIEEDYPCRDGLIPRRTIERLCRLTIDNLAKERTRIFEQAVGLKARAATDGLVAAVEAEVLEALGRWLAAQGKLIGQRGASTYERACGGRGSH